MELADHAFRMVLLDDDPALLYEQAPCGYLSTTDDGSIVKVNATLCTWLGREPEELLGRRFAELLPPRPLYLRRPDAQVPAAYKAVTPR